MGYLDRFFAVITKHYREGGEGREGGRGGRERERERERESINKNASFLLYLESQHRPRYGTDHENTFDPAMCGCMGIIQ